jgi:hypothetical protein
MLYPGRRFFSAAVLWLRLNSGHGVAQAVSGHAVAQGVSVVSTAMCSSGSQCCFSGRAVAQTVKGHAVAQAVSVVAVAIL